MRYSFLVHRVFIFVVLITVSGLYTNTQRIIRYFLIIIIFVAVFYLSVTIQNWCIFQTNGNLLHSHMIEVPELLLLGLQNEFYTIRIHATITDRRTQDISNRISTFISQLIQQNQSLTTIKIMCYKKLYLKTICFLNETILYFSISIGGISNSLLLMTSLYLPDTIHELFDSTI